MNNPPPNPCIFYAPYNGMVNKSKFAKKKKKNALKERFAMRDING